MNAITIEWNGHGHLSNLFYSRRRGGLGRATSIGTPWWTVVSKVFDKEITVNCKFQQKRIITIASNSIRSVYLQVPLQIVQNKYQIYSYTIEMQCNASHLSEMDSILSVIKTVSLLSIICGQRAVPNTNLRNDLLWSAVGRTNHSRMNVAYLSWTVIHAFWALWCIFFCLSSQTHWRRCELAFSSTKKTSRFAEKIVSRWK